MGCGSGGARGGAGRTIAVGLLTVVLGSAVGAGAASAATPEKLLEAAQKACDDGNAAACYQLGAAQVTGRVIVGRETVKIAADPASGEAALRTGCHKGSCDACWLLLTGREGAPAVRDAELGKRALDVCGKGCKHLRARLVAERAGRQAAESDEPYYASITPWLRGESECALVARIHGDGLAGEADPKKAAAEWMATCEAGDGDACMDTVRAVLGGGMDSASLRKAEALLAKRCAASASMEERRDCSLYGQLPSLRRTRARCAGGLDAACADAGEMLLSAEARDDALVLLEPACGRSDWRSCELAVRAARDRKPPVPALQARAMAMEQRLEAACDADDALACRYLGQTLTPFYESSERKERGQALRKRSDAMLEKACTDGSVAACSVWGQALYHGWSIPKDPERASTVLDKACQDGAAEACDLLGYVRGLPADEEGRSGDDIRAARQARWSLTARGCVLGYEESCRVIEANSRPRETSKGRRTPPLPEVVEARKTLCTAGLGAFCR
ncbi:MAG: hypothetical protein R3F39_24960 [Myxococcota bacterium]